MLWHPLYTFTSPSAAAPETVRPSGGRVRRAWNPLLPFEEQEKEPLLEAVRIIEEESEVKRERAKARKLEREIVNADSSADMRALAARITWAIERANELRKQEDDDAEVAVVLMLLH